MSSTQEVGEIFGQGRGPAHAMLRSPTVLIASVGLWGMNVFFYRLFGIHYIKVFKRDLLEIEEMENPTGKKGGSSSSVEMTSTMVDNFSDHSDADSTTNDGGESVYSSTDELYLLGNSAGAAATAAVIPNVTLPPRDKNSGAITWERLVSLSVTLLFLLHFTYV